MGTIQLAETVEEIDENISYWRELNNVSGDMIKAIETYRKDSSRNYTRKRRLPVTIDKNDAISSKLPHKDTEQNEQQQASIKPPPKKKRKKPPKITKISPFVRDKKTYISKIVNNKKLKFPDHMIDKIINAAVKLTSEMEGCHPSGVCGAAILIAARMYGLQRRIKVMAGIVNISHTVISKRVKELTKKPIAYCTVEGYIEQMDKYGCDII
eukprot:113517_1